MFGHFKKNVVPSPFYMEGVHSMSEFTPDIGILEQRNFWLLFVYDRWQQEHEDYPIMLGDASVPCGTAFTKEKFHMFKRRLGKDSDAIALDSTWSSVPSHSVRGQLHLVESSHYTKLDTVKRNGVHFERRRVSLLMPYTQYGWKSDGGMWKLMKLQELRAFMYVGLHSHWDDLLDGGFLFDRVRSYKPNRKDLSEYFVFNKKEYFD